jgi:hypothetical protein
MLRDEEGGSVCRQLGDAQGVEFITSDEAARFSHAKVAYLAETVNGRRVDFDVMTYGVGLD